VKQTLDRPLPSGWPWECASKRGPDSRVRQWRHGRKDDVTFGLPLKAWSVDELLEMLARKDFNLIHGEVIDALEKLGDVRAVEPLLAKVREGSGNDSTFAMYALKRLAPETLPGPLLDVVRSRQAMGFHAAAALLGELGAVQAVPLLVDALRDLEPRETYLSECVGQQLAAFGPAGFDALVELLADKAPAIRRRAAAGLMYTNKAAAADALRPLLHDPDPKVRETAALVIDALPVQPNRR
jgi:HEAT repeat protein